MLFLLFGCPFEVVFLLVLLISSPVSAPQPEPSLTPLFLLRQIVLLLFPL